VQTDRGTIWETYELMASTVRIPEKAVVLGVINTDGT
jgi:hypothetical protein